MFVQFFIIILGFILLIYGADLLVKGASGIAKKFHISDIIIGLTIVSIGTSLPELIITLVSSSKESHDLIIGNVIGSNICNLLLILGILSIIKPIQFDKSTVKANFPILVLINALILILAFVPVHNNTLNISFIEGCILLIIAFIYFLIPLIKYFKENRNISEKTTFDISINNSLFKNFAFILLGGFALKYGGDFVVNSSIKIAEHLNISKNIIGLTIIALGTSLPELITSIVAVLKGNTHMAEGNIIGSCIINFCLILGFGAVISNLVLDSKYIENLILLLGSTTLIWLYSLSNEKHILKRSNGIILLSIFAVYIIRLFIV